MQRCSVCKRKVDTLRSAVKDGQYLSDRCDRCLAAFGGFADSARKYERDWQKREYAADLVQPWERDKYLKLYPERAREHGYTDEDFRLYG